MTPRRSATLLWTATVLLAAGCGASTANNAQTRLPTTSTTATASPRTTPAITSSTPSPTPPTPSAASPTPTTASQAPPPPAPATSPDNPPSNPAAVVTAYFAAINAKDYTQAWALGGKNLATSYTQFAQGYADTAEDSVEIQGVSGNTVTINLTATNNNDTQQDFTGTYTVTGRTITAASVSQIQPADSALCGAPANPYGYNLCGRGTRVYSPPSDICTYFTCIENFRYGHGYMVECTDGTYSMSGGIEEVCNDHGGELKTVWNGP
jgi:hypothetical protein